MKQPRLLCGIGMAGLYLALLPSLAMAQRVGNSPLEQVRQALANLNLTPEQKTKVDSVMDSVRSDAMELRQKLREMPPRERRQKMQQLLAGARTKIEAELTGEQKEQFERKLAGIRVATGRQMMAAALDRLQKAVGDLNLSTDQRSRVEAALDRVTAQLKDLKDDTDLQEQFQQTMQGLRKDLAEILTPEQQQAFARKMQTSEPEAAAATDREKTPPPPSTRPAAVPPAAMPESQSMMQPQPVPDPAVKPAVVELSKPAALGPDIGQPAPEFKLTQLNGSIVQLSALKGRVIVLVFGSYTCPTFRNRAAGLEQLSRELGTRATLFIVYTREAHPKGGWEAERNKEEKISIADATDAAGRLALARQARESLHLNIPILVDDMSNSVTESYGGFPNGAVVINRDGTIAGRQQWVEPTALRRMVDQAVAKPVTKQ